MNKCKKIVPFIKKILFKKIKTLHLTKSMTEQSQSYSAVQYPLASHWVVPN